MDRKIVPTRTIDEVFDEEFSKRLVDATSRTNNLLSIKLEVDDRPKRRKISLSAKVTLSSILIVWAIYLIVELAIQGVTFFR